MGTISPKALVLPATGIQTAATLPSFWIEGEKVNSPEAVVTSDGRKTSNGGTATPGWTTPGTRVTTSTANDTRDLKLAASARGWSR